MSCGHWVCTSWVKPGLRLVQWWFLKSFWGLKAAVLWCSLHTWGLYWWWKIHMRIKTKGWKWERLMCWCNRPAQGGEVEGKGLQMQLSCTLIYHPGSRLSAETWLFGNWPKALMKAGRRRSVFVALGGPFLLRLSAFSEETHHHPALCWIRAFEVFCLICVTASVTQHRTFSVFFLSLLQFHPPGVTARDETELNAVSWNNWGLGNAVS